jgi:hypothetical protein
VSKLVFSNTSSWPRFSFSRSVLTTLQARVACPSRVYAFRRYISKTVFFMYPYVFVAGPNKHDNLLDYLCRRNAKFDRLARRRLGRGGASNASFSRLSRGERLENACPLSYGVFETPFDGHMGDLGDPMPHNVFSAWRFAAQQMMRTPRLASSVILLVMFNPRNTCTASALR